MKKAKAMLKKKEDQMYADMIAQDRMDSPSETYQEDQGVIDSANSTIRSGRGFQNEVERQGFMKMSNEEKTKFLKAMAAKKGK